MFKQTLCIDLPGQPIQCWAETDVKVILRKHRDVIFDIDTGKGATYTLESPEDWFYDTRVKKRKSKTTFMDGERLHVWVGRDFKGELVLSVNGKAVIRKSIAQLDTTQYSADPKVKPAPIILSFGVRSAQPHQQANSRNGPAPAPQKPSHSLLADGPQPISTTYAQEPEPTQTVHVVEVQPKPVSEVPKEIADFFKQGGENTAVDPNGLLTRNWLWAQIVGATAYYGDNKPWIDELFRQKFQLQKVNHKSGPKWYIIFKGNPRLREYISATRYGIMAPKVLAITAGAGSASAMRHAAWDAMKGSIKGAGGFAVIFTITLDTAEWLADFEQRDPKTGKPKKDFFDLVAKIGIDLAKAGLSAALGVLAMSAVLGFAGGGLVALVAIGTVIFAIGFGVLLDLTEKKVGITDFVATKIRSISQNLEDKFPADYKGYPQVLTQ